MSEFVTFKCDSKEVKKVFNQIMSEDWWFIHHLPFESRAYVKSKLEKKENPFYKQYSEKELPFTGFLGLVNKDPFYEYEDNFMKVDNNLHQKCNPFMKEEWYNQ